jgi:hypothetical protein
MGAATQAGASTKFNRAGVGTSGIRADNGTNVAGSGGYWSALCDACIGQAVPCIIVDRRLIQEIWISRTLPENPKD